MTAEPPPHTTRRAFLGGIGRVGLGAALLLLAVASALPVGPALASGVDKKGRLSATRYFTLAPFTMPLIEDGIITEQMTLVIALELAADDKREEVQHLVAKIRDALYRELYAMVTFRRKGAPMPDVDRFKVRLYRVVRGVAGEKRVKSLLIQQAFKRPAR